MHKDYSDIKISAPVQIVLARTAMDMSQDDLCAAVGISRPTLNRIEKAEALRIQDAHLISEMDALFRGEGIGFVSGEGDGPHELFGILVPANWHPAKDCHANQPEPSS